MAKSNEQLEKDLSALMSTVDDLVGRVKKLEDAVVKTGAATVDALNAQANRILAGESEVERISDELEKVTRSGAPALEERVVALEKSVAGVNAVVLHVGGNEALPADHVLSASRKGLPEYEEARTKLLKQKTGEIVELVHRGKSVKLDYAQGREILRQAQVI